MDLTVQALACLVGLALLAVASDHFVAGSAALARHWGVSPLAVGVVVIGFGTSAPELLVSASAALAGAPGVGVGNVIGSNIANLSLILGVTAVIAPIAVGSAVLYRQMPLSLAACAAFALTAQGGFSRAEGLLLLGLLVVGLVLMLRWSGETGGSEELVEDVQDYVAEAAAGGRGRDVARTVLGLLGTLAGAQALVWGAVGIAESAGVSQGVVGVTLVALGTSLPELVTAAQAARTGETDLVVGNLLGSNLFNALAVGGLVAVLAPGPAGGPDLLRRGTALMLAVTLVALLLMRRGQRVSRAEGAALVLGYLACLAVLT